MKAWLCFPENPDSHCKVCARHGEVPQPGQCCVYALENSASELCEFLPRIENELYKDRGTNTASVTSTS